jgi:alpha 1,2-mannosyltransferase
MGEESARTNVSIYTNMNGFKSSTVFHKSPKQLGSESAAIVVLTRNSELPKLVDSITSFEASFNKYFRYPYVFINNEPFTQDFKTVIKAQSSADMEFVQVENGTWEYPVWINQTYAKECRQDMERRNVFYGGSESYRFMCRFFSGWFFRHPAVMKYEYYWRVEPSVEFYCNVDEDPFKYMKENNKLYGFKIMPYEFMNTMPTLWKTALEWKNKQGIGNTSLWDVFTKNGEYTGCHFWTNFEIAKTDLWKNEAYLSFFNYLDRAGGFFYERYSELWEL